MHKCRLKFVFGIYSNVVYTIFKLVSVDLQGNLR